MVVDTNGWLSAALSPQGAPSQVLRRVLVVGVPVFSDAIFAELEQRIFSRDEDDDKFIHTALASQARWLVTGDQDLLVINMPLPVRILTPCQVLQLQDFPGGDGHDLR